jgi:hypothetical protein
VYIPPEEEDTVPIVPEVTVPPIESLTVAVPAPTDSIPDSLTARRTDAQGRTADSSRDSLP